METTNKQEELKIYYFQRERRERRKQKYIQTLAVEKEEIKANKIKQIEQKMEQIKNSLENLPQAKLSPEESIRVEMAEEFIECSKKTLGENLQRLFLQDDNKIESLYRLSNQIIEELMTLPSKEEKSLDNSEEKVN